METNQQPTCEDRVERSMTNRLSDIRQMIAPAIEDIELLDDGTLDTVIGIRDIDVECRYSQDERAMYCDPEFDVDEFIADHADDVLEQASERFYEYGLSWDYVPADEDQDQGFFRYQISYGGPSEEIRFYCDPGFNMYRAEFWYLDWFDGAHRVCTSEAQDLWEALTFGDTESLQRMVNEATN